QQTRLGSSSSHDAISGSPRAPLDSSQNTAALTKSKLLASNASRQTSKLPPMSMLLGVALNDLNQAISLQTGFLQALLKRGTVFHILGRYHDAISDLMNVLSSPFL